MSAQSSTSEFEQNITNHTQGKPPQTQTLIMVALFSSLLTFLAGAIYQLNTKPSFDGGPIYDNLNGDTILLNVLTSQIKDKSTGLALLDEVALKFDALPPKHPEKHSLATNLIAAYLQYEQFERAVALNKQLTTIYEKAFGRHHKNTELAYQMLLETMLQTRQRSLTLDLAKSNLKNVLAHLGDDLRLVAISHIRLADAYLYCLYPDCDRRETIKTARQHATLAKDILIDAGLQNSGEMGQALMLINWYTNDYPQKVALVSQALSIFEQNYGRYDRDTAAAYLHLGRAYSAWDKAPEKAIEYLKEALHIHLFLYHEKHLSVLFSLNKLGRVLLAQGQFDEAAGYLRRAFRAGTSPLNCQDFYCLKPTEALTKAYLYGGDHKQAALLSQTLQSILKEKSVKLPFSAELELNSLILRVQSANLPLEKPIEQVQKALQLLLVADRRAANETNTSKQEHELHHQLLILSPKSLDTDQYIKALKIILEAPHNPTLSPSDKTYLVNRMKQNCNRHSPKFCRQLVSNLPLEKWL